MRLGVDGERRLVAVAPDHTDAGLGCLPLVQREEVGERLDRCDPPARLVGDQFAPLRRLGDSRLHDAKVLGVLVGEDHEAVAPVVDVVFDAVALARTRNGTAAGSAVGSSQFSDVSLLRERMTIQTLLRVVPMWT